MSGGFKSFSVLNRAVRLVAKACDERSLSSVGLLRLHPARTLSCDKPSHGCV